MAMKIRWKIPYSWVIVTLSFVSVAVSTGIMQSIVILFPALLEEFQWSRTVLSVAPALSGIFASIGGLLIGWIADRRDLRVIIAVSGAVAAIGLLLTSRVATIWQLYLFYGVFVSMGIYGLGTMPHTLIITRWFPKRRGTIIGIVNAGYGVGMVIFMPLLQGVIGAGGWQDGYLMLAAVLAVLVPLILFFQRAHPKVSSGVSDKPMEKRTQPEISSFRFIRKLFRLPRYWLCFVQFVLGPLSTTPINIHQAAMMQDKGISPTASSWIVGLSGVGMTFGMLIGGFLSDRIGREKSYTLGTVCLLLGCISLLLIQSSNLIAPVAYALLYGFGMGTRPSMDAATASDLFKNHRFGLVLGTLATALGIGQLAGPVIGGAVFDITGSYFGVIIFCMITAVVATLAIWLTAPRKGPVEIFGGK
jgi:MFS transporter, OFA family, oxalate/formate antiporter